MNTKKVSKHVRSMVYVGMLTALAFALYYMEIPAGFLVPVTPFLKIDFSDVPALIATLGLGPIAGTLVELLKNILHIAITKEPALSGEVGNFLSGMCMVLPLWIAMRKNKSIGHRFLAISASAICCAIAMAIFNFYITLPLYGIADSSVKNNMLLYGFLPFNLLKGVLIPTISIIVYDLLSKYKLFPEDNR